MAYSTYHVLRVFRWETQNALRQSELRFRTIATAAPVILFMEDQEGLISFLEGKGLDSLGLKSDELIGRPMFRLFPNISSIKQENRNLRPGETYSSHVVVNNMTFELCYSPVADSRGEAAGFIGVALDIAQRTRAQAELDRNRQEMIRTKHLTELGTISTAMTGEIERPLKVTQLLLERLLKNVGGSVEPETVAKSLEKSLSEVNKAVSVLERFSDFAQLSPVTQAKPIDLYQFAKRIMAVCAGSASRVNLELVTEGLDVVSCVSMAERELEYVFLVLIQNAIGAAGHSKTERLTISCEMSDNHMRLTFADTCRSIPAEQLKNIFQPFFAAEPDGKETEFSLAIVNHIVNTCGGAIGVESTPDSRATASKFPIFSVDIFHPSQLCVVLF